MEYSIWNKKTLKENYPNVFFHLHRFYFNTPNKNGVDPLNEVIEKNILKREIYERNWEKGFLEKLSRKINHEVIGATYGLAPSLGGKIILKKNDTNERIEELVFFVSLLTNYYSIQIVEIDKFIISNDYFSNKEAWGVKKIVVSPIPEENGNLFKVVENFISEEIQNAKILPFRFDTIKVKNFQVEYKYVKDYSSISDGFFNKGLIFHKDTQVIGDIDYMIYEIETTTK